MANSTDFTHLEYNCIYYVVGGSFYLMTIQQVTVGQELLVKSYGVNWWKYFGYPGGVYQPLRPRALPTQMNVARVVTPHARSRRSKVSDGHACMVCKSPDMDDQMLICDHCLDGYHGSCLYPPVEVEESEALWFCPSCQGAAM
jgi:hypothetical protein